MTILDSRRVGIAAQANGIARAAYDAALKLCEGAPRVRRAHRIIFK